MPAHPALYIPAHAVSYSAANVTRFSTAVSPQRTTLPMLPIGHANHFNPSLWMAGAAQYPFLAGMVPSFESATRGRAADVNLPFRAPFHHPLTNASVGGGYKVAQDSVTGQYFIIPGIV